MKTTSTERASDKSLGEQTTSTASSTMVMLVNEQRQKPWRHINDFDALSSMSRYRNKDSK